MKWKLRFLIIANLSVFTTACKKQVETGITGPTTTTSTNIPSGAGDGVTFINSGKSAIFNLYAPGKTAVSVIGDFNNWQGTAMTKTSDGNRWWVQIDNLDASKLYSYQYYVDNSIKIADPYTELVLDPDNDKYISADTYPNLLAYPTGKTTGNVSTMQANPTTYAWKNTSFTRPDKSKLVIYELHIRDFIQTHNYQTLKDTLSYLSNLGVNAIELMPFNEFEANDSWGYNPSFYFAPDKYYGTKNALKAFIDECHSRGIAVIQDMVLNHSFGQSPMVQLYFNTATSKPASNSPWFNVDATHPYNVGYDFNHESAATKYFAKNVMKFWMQEYKIDGYRFDLSKGFTQKNSGTDVNTWSAYDASRIAIWKDYNNYIKAIDPNFYVILEHFAADQEEKELSNEGMILWNNLNFNANQATMSYNDAAGYWDLSRLFYDTHSFTMPYNLVGYIESHDEERLQFKNGQYGNSSGSYNIKNLATGLKRDEMAAAFLLSTPGPKMLWQFGELGYDKSIDQNGRTGDKPILWNYTSDANRKHLYNTYAQLIKMKIKNAVFTTTNFKYSLAGAIKTIQLNGTDGVNVEVVGNFDVVAQTGSISFPSTGTWYDNITGTSINVNTTPYMLTLAPGEYHLYSTTALKQ
ncbi:MAG: alpha-amylase [Sphingobacteriaceae bacterium]|nr:MAG: alpha-amylase [Sphingobacteriaceae bacterium]